MRPIDAPAAPPPRDPLPGVTVKVLLGTQAVDVPVDQLAEMIRAFRVGPELEVSGPPLTGDGEWRRLGALPFYRESLAGAEPPPYGFPPPLPTGPPAPPGAVELHPVPPEARRVGRWNALLERPPLVTLGLILGCAALFAVTSVYGGTHDVSVLGRFGAKVGPRIWRGELWRIVTANFLHGGVLHVASNAVGLYVLGRMGENLFSRRIYFALFVATGITAQAASFLLIPAISLGASGPIFGILGALIAFHWRRRRQVPPMHRGTLAALLVWAAWSVAAGYLEPGVDNWAHGGGLAGGLLLGLLIPAPAVDDDAPRPAGLPRTLLAAAALAVLLGAGVLQAAAALARHDAVAHRHMPAGFRIEHPVDWSRKPDGDVLVLTDDIGAVVFVGRTDVVTSSDDDPRHVALQLIEGLRRPDAAEAEAAPDAAAVGHAESQVTAAGRRWWRFEGKTRLADDGAEFWQRIDVTETGGHAYFIVALAPRGSWHRYRGTFDRILSSFQLP